MRALAVFGKPFPLFLMCVLISWAIYFWASLGEGFGERIMSLQRDALGHSPLMIIVALSAFLLVSTYLGHHILRMKSLDFKQQANVSKSQKDRLTKQAISLSKDAGLLIKTSLNLYLAMCASLVLLALVPLWAALFPESPLLNVQWRYALVGGLGLFVFANLWFALERLYQALTKRAKAA